MTPNQINYLHSKVSNSGDIAFERLDKMLTKVASQDSNAKMSHSSNQSGELTSLELRVLQTRKFNKSPGLVKEALENIFKDEGGHCRLLGPYAVPIGQARQSDPKNPAKSKLVVDGYTVTKGGGTCQSPKRTTFVIQFEFDTQAPTRRLNEPLWFDQEFAGGRDSKIYPQTETSVRLRLQSFRNGAWQPVVDPTPYDEVFRKISDQLFVDAIPIDPKAAE